MCNGHTPIPYIFPMFNSPINMGVAPCAPISYASGQEGFNAQDVPSAA